ncbi:DUF4184 family protein [Brevibacillus borstelensis]|uniref:DUF4184 family protein n=1 Tax=Brevibacillus borstelensis TaxID=45462 RepID=UPI0030C15C29
MPFTFAHPAIVLPLRGVRRFSFLALVFGSMAPDFEYFLRLQPYSSVSHTWAGLFLFDLPMTFLLAVLFHGIVKRAVIAHLPAPFDRGLLHWAEAPWALTSLRSFLVFCYSAVLGSVTHIVWDSFTHDGAFMVSRLPLLQQNAELAGLAIPVYKFFQHGSTLIGLLCIGIVIAKETRHGLHANHLERKAGSKPVKAQDRSRSCREKWFFWLCVAGFGVFAAGTYLFSIGGLFPHFRPLRAVVPFLSGCMLGLIVVSWLSRLGRPPRR